MKGYPPSGVLSTLQIWVGMSHDPYFRHYRRRSGSHLSSGFKRSPLNLIDGHICVSHVCIRTLGLVSAIAWVVPGYFRPTWTAFHRIHEKSSRSADLPLSRQVRWTRPSIVPMPSSPARSCPQRPISGSLTSQIRKASRDQCRSSPMVQQLPNFV